MSPLDCWGIPVSFVNSSDLDGALYLRECGGRQHMNVINLWRHWHPARCSGATVESPRHEGCYSASAVIGRKSNHYVALANHRISRAQAPNDMLVCRPS